jgi:hypothetical protein
MTRVGLVNMNGFLGERRTHEVPLEAAKGDSHILPLEIFGTGKEVKHL